MTKRHLKTMMPAPALTLGFILATLYGALFHLIVGGDARRLAMFLLAGWLGFALGHVLGTAMNIRILNIGSLHVVSATLGAFIALLAAQILRRPSQNTRN
jgi:uncharacterized membrane protein YeaQ/YmgE (transglycosylase-associated protein family)